MQASGFKLPPGFELAPGFELPPGFELAPRFGQDFKIDLDMQFQSKPKPRSQLQKMRYDRQHRLPVGNKPEEISYVNDNPGKKIVLYAEGGGFIVSWYYGQTEEGEYYKQAFVGFEGTEETYYLEGPLDPEKVCAIPVKEEVYTSPAPLKVFPF
jgi:hypothetical protein